MGSSLLISVFDVPYGVPYPSPAAAADEDLPVHNLVSPKRYQLFQFATAAASNSIRYDCGTGVTKSVDHLIIGRADILKTAGMTTINLAGGSDGVTFGTTAHNNASFSSATLYGPRANDYVVEIATTAALRWWRPTYSGGSSKYCHAALSFGSFFDFGTEVSKVSKIERVPAKESKFYTDSGAEWQARISEEIYKLQLVWKGVTVAKATTFMSTIGRYLDRMSLFLYTPTTPTYGPQHWILDNQRLLQVRCTRISKVDEKYNRQTFTLDFEEVLG